MPNHAGSSLPDAAAPNLLSRLIGHFAQPDGDHTTVIPALTLHRRSATTAPLHCIYSLGFGVVAQGCKRVMLGREAIVYGPGQSMLTTIDSPVVSRVTRASGREPFLGMMVTLDAQSIMQLSAEVDVPPGRLHAAARSISIGPLDAGILDALVRLVSLLQEPALALRVAPLIKQEIIIRLLSGPHGPQLRQLVTAGSPNQRIARSVAWLKQHFTHALQVGDLAARAHMSPSTFRHHFRAITGSSPLQYQKQLRLQEARQLMLSQSVDAGSAAFSVGYESASQFSREYRRMFGAPPRRDLKRIRQV